MAESEEELGRYRQGRCIQQEVEIQVQWEEEQGHGDSRETEKEKAKMLVGQQRSEED